MTPGTGPQRKISPTCCTSGMRTSERARFLCTVSTLKCTAVTRRPLLPDNGHVHSLQPNSSPTVSGRIILGPAYAEDAKETACCKWVLAVAELLTLLSMILMQRNLARCNRTICKLGPVIVGKFGSQVLVANLPKKKRKKKVLEESI